MSGEHDRPLRPMCTDKFKRSDTRLEILEQSVANIKDQLASQKTETLVRLERLDTHLKLAAAGIAFGVGIVSPLITALILRTILN